MQVGKLKFRRSHIIILCVCALLTVPWLWSQAEHRMNPYIPLRSTNPPFKLLRHETIGIETVDVLVPNSKNGYIVAKNIEQYCGEWHCTVNLFDSKEAFAIYKSHQESRDSMSPKDNRFVSKHYVGELYFFEPSKYLNFPLKNGTQK